MNGLPEERPHVVVLGGGLAGAACAHRLGDEGVQVTLVDRNEEIPFELRSRSVDGRFDIWKVRSIMSPGTLQEWNFHHVPMFATRASDVTTQLIAAARRGVTLYDPL